MSFFRGLMIKKMFSFIKVSEKEFAICEYVDATMRKWDDMVKFTDFGMPIYNTLRYDD